MSTTPEPSTGGALAPILVTVAILAAAAGAWLAMGLLQPQGATPSSPTVQAATLLPTPKPLADFALRDQDGAPLTPAELRGQWTFLAFGFTSCPDVCPTTLANLAAVSRQLAAAGVAPARVLFVSVDPERDSPERLAEYVRHFNTQFLGATGTHEALRALTAQLGVLYARAPEQDTALGYLVDHSAAILLLDPQVRLAAIFSAPQDPGAMAADYSAIAQHSKTTL